MSGGSWIDTTGAKIAGIVESVKACPSGALSYTVGEVEHRYHEGPPSVQFAPNGPYVVKGGSELKGVEWGEGASVRHRKGRKGQYPTGC